MNLAVIDLGSNTFHLLLAEVVSTGFVEIHRERIFVGLAEGGIATIRPAAIVRAQQAIQQLADTVQAYEIDQLRIVGTAALRSAQNGYIINDAVRDVFGQDIEIISGIREAELIYKGIQLLSEVTDDTQLIIDIGGGSTEFILVAKGELLWSQSFNIGVAVLHELFHKSEPISAADVAKMDRFLEHELQPLALQLAQHTVHELVGASGSFEVMATMAGRPVELDQLQTFTVDNFYAAEELVVAADYEQRLRLEGMPASRVKLIVVAFLLIRYVVRLSGCKSISISPYALKEGLIAETMQRIN